VRPIFHIALLAAIFASHAAEAKDWVWSSGTVEEDAGSLFRFQTRLNLWVSNYDRPERACEFGAFDVPLPEPTFRSSSLRAAQVDPGFFGCNASSSDEIGIGPGIEVSFKIMEPLHVTAGFDLVYTLPDSSIIKNQIVIGVPFGVLITFPEWAFRPIIHPKIIPVLYLTDDSRDYTIGADLGAAWRAGEWGDLSLTLGYYYAETMSSWQLQLALHPI
jgi:hypothetical protein